MGKSRFGMLLDKIANINADDAQPHVVARQPASQLRKWGGKLRQ